ncbi:MAG TPA: hypothetical protein VIV11_11125 [Kofleriaceae bacterium]
MAIRLSLGEMIGAGTRAVARYTGTLLSVFIAQAAVTIVCMLAVTSVLTDAFGHLPLWDEAVDGDLVALVYCVRFAEASLSATAGVVMWSVLLWVVISWFLVGGVNNVLAQRPEGRGETARCFGAGGSNTFLAYAKLALCSIPGWLAATALLLWGFDRFASEERMMVILTLPQLVGTLLLAALPGLFVLHIVWTVTDYARVELTLRHDSHEPSVVMTYLRTLAFVLKRPITLAHGGLGWLAFLLITVGYMWLAAGHSMYGAGGAVTLFVIRQGVALARSAIRFGVLGGQLELGKTRPLPPRRIVETKVESKKA